jgi:hypothetical protein
VFLYSKTSLGWFLKDSQASPLCPVFLFHPHSPARHYPLCHTQPNAACPVWFPCRARPSACFGLVYPMWPAAAQADIIMLVAIQASKTEETKQLFPNWRFSSNQNEIELPFQIHLCYKIESVVPTRLGANPINRSASRWISQRYKLQTLAFAPFTTVPVHARSSQTNTTASLRKPSCTHLIASHHQPSLRDPSRHHWWLGKTGRRCTPSSDRPCRLKTT